MNRKRYRNKIKIPNEMNRKYYKNEIKIHNKIYKKHFKNEIKIPKNTRYEKQYQIKAWETVQDEIKTKSQKIHDSKSAWNPNEIKNIYTKKSR